MLTPRNKSIYYPPTAGYESIMETIKIKRAASSDVALLQEIGRQTFFETFAAGNSEENMQKYLQEGFSTEKLGAELAEESSTFYFAWSGEKVIGYLKLNSGASQTELQDRSAVEIERIYVLKDWHGKKVGDLLFEKALEVARQSHAAYLWLGVWEENPRAIRFYQKNGFVAFDRHIFKLGDEEQTDIMMKLTL